APPGTGALTLNNGTSDVPVSIGQFVLVSDINAGKLKFAPASNGTGLPYTTFTFQVKDDGGTTNGGTDLDPTARLMTVNVTPVNDEPAGQNKTVTPNEDATFTFATTDFGFTDLNDTPANTLLAVKIGTLPAA